MTLMDELAAMEETMACDEHAISAMVSSGLSKMQLRIAATIAARGEITTKELQRAIYGTKQNSRGRLHVHLVATRRKLTAHGIEIRTLWGAGYAMTPADRIRFKQILEGGAA